MPAADMLGVVAILLIAVDIFANLHYLDAYDKPALKWLIPGAVLGVVVGYVVLHFMVHLTSDKASFDRTLSLTIGGQRFELTGGGADAWASGKAADAAIVAAMRSAPRMAVSGVDSAGRRFSDRYSLDGVATAMDAATVGCAGKR